MAKKTKTDTDEYAAIIKRLDRLAVTEALAVSLWNSLALVVEYVQRVGGYMESRDQKTLREAIALLEEVSRVDYGD